jgi:NAD(P)-dependent dehydrogenase (short-subunit alcohol dehydrogenase family)
MENDMSSNPTTVLVTGAAGNLGRAVARAFAAQGANLALIDLRRESLTAAFGSEDARRLFLPTDLLARSPVEGAVRTALERFGRIDVLCNIAGGFRMGTPVHETSDKDWEFLLDINVRTLLNCVRAVVPQMIARGGGKIINVGAASALRGVAQMGAYCAAKSALIRLTEAMAAELREKNINVNCVLPTIIDTPENRAAMPDADPARWVAPDDLAKVFLFLASEDARAIHGAAVPVSGLS